MAGRCLRDPMFSRFSKTPACHRLTDRHMTTGNTVASMTSRGKKKQKNVQALDF